MLAPRSLTEGGIFAVHALQLQAHGLAVLPIDGDKKPLVKGWRKWCRPPSTKTITQLGRQFHHANVAILPGPSRVFVADVDTADQAGEVEELLGPTPLHVRSRRGVHLYYRDADDCSGLPGNLRNVGLDVDLKAGNSIVAVPPSRHESGTIYRLERCTWEALRELPPPNLAQVRRLLAKEAPHRRGERYSVGERGLGLNRILCRHGPYCDTFEDLLDVAQTANADFLPPLTDAEVVKRARQVWKDVEEGKLVRMVGRSSSARTTAAEIDKLAAMGREGSDALMLLMKLRTAHTARVARQETFAIVAEAMAREQTIAGWHWKRYVAATKFLLAAGFIVLVSKHRPSRAGCRPALYEVPLVSWTPEHLCSRRPQWQERTHLTRRSSGVR